MPNENLITIIAAIFGGLIGFAALITAITTSIGSAKKGAIESLNFALMALQDEYKRVIDDLKILHDENNKLKNIVNGLIKENHDLQNKVSALEAENIQKDIMIKSLLQQIHKLQLMNEP